jgi:hypothetical protein
MVAALNSSSRSSSLCCCCGMIQSHRDPKDRMRYLLWRLGGECSHLGITTNTALPKSRKRMLERSKDTWHLASKWAERHTVLAVGCRNYHPGTVAGDQTDYGEYNACWARRPAGNPHPTFNVRTSTYLEEPTRHELETMYSDQENVSTSCTGYQSINWAQAPCLFVFSPVFTTIMRRLLWTRLTSPCLPTRANCTWEPNSRVTYRVIRNHDSSRSNQ